MSNPHENYEQEKIKGEVKQTVIVDETETGETDELDPKFHEDESPDIDPADPGDIIPEKGLEIENTEVDDAGLNHDADDDLSLNKAEDELY